MNDIAVNIRGGIVMELADINLDEETLAEFCKRYQIVKLEVFGSVVRGKLKKKSDVDFLVTYAPDKKFQPWCYLPEEDEMAALIGRKVDWLFRSTVEASRNPIFRKEVLSTAKVIFEAR
jgi:uncharacterized protein